MLHPPLFSSRNRQGRAGLLAAILMVLAPLLSILPANAQRYEPEKTIIVYGGFGYLDNVQQHWLHDLIRRNASGQSKYPDLGRQLEQDLAEDARSILSRNQMRKWTTHPVIFSADDLGLAYQALTGETSYDTAKMFSAFDRAYLLVLSGGFEHQATLKTGQNKRSFTAYATVGVSATLVDLTGSNDILLSATHLALHTTPTLPSAQFDALNTPQTWAGRFSAAYRAGSSGALTQLGVLAKDSDPADVINAWDTYMITGAFVAPGPDTSPAARLFDWQQSAEIGTLCQPRNYCTEGSEACNAMRGYLTSAAGQALSEAGLKVMPPMSWSERARDPNSIVSYKLSLPSSGLPNLVRSTGFIYDPDRATYKTVPVLLGNSLRSYKGPDGINYEDSYTASVVIQTGRTAPSDCSTVVQEAPIGAMSIGAKTDAGRPLSETETERSARQLMTLLAIKEAMSELSETIK